MEAGYYAAGSFLLTAGVGSSAQVVKLWRRTRLWRDGGLSQESVTAGLLPFRELIAYLGFLLFALSALTRSSVDPFILGSRLPTVLLATCIMWFLQFHGVAKARRYFLIILCGDILLGIISTLVACGFHYGGGTIAGLIDGSLAAVAILLFYGKVSQARRMVQTGASAAVSWVREVGLILKDALGLWYSLLVGAELIWISVMHVLSGLSGLAICAAKYRVERRGRL